MEDLTKEELQEQIIYLTITNLINTVDNLETKDIARECLRQLKAAELDTEVSTTFISSIFNFHNVYRPLYDLLDLSTNGALRGAKMTDEYRNGIIDSILALKKYEKNHGLGDLEWEINYNTVNNREYDKNIEGYIDVKKEFE